MIFQNKDLVSQIPISAQLSAGFRFVIGSGMRWTKAAGNDFVSKVAAVG